MYFLNIFFSAYLFMLVFPSSPSPFITTWNTELPGTTCDSCIEIPTDPLYVYEYDVDWDNDGIWDELDISGNAIHTYGSPGVYTIAIRKTFPKIYFNNSGDAEKLISIDQWGNNVWSDMSKAFNGCKNLAGQATDNPELISVKSMFSMFSGAEVFNQDISFWDVANVTDMAYMFSDATAFNRDISKWKVHNVKFFEHMFAGASSFNQDIFEWDVSGGQLFRGMFKEANSFNQDISLWNVSSATEMISMFESAISFDQDISNWQFPNVNVMANMFFKAESFNQDLSLWNMSAVSNMKSIFDSSGIDVNNYDLFLIGLTKQIVQDSLEFGADNLKYCNGTSARDSLIHVHGWTIIGDSQQNSNFNLLQASPANWYGSKANWMQGHYPTQCDIVIISNNRNTAVTSGNKAYAKTLRVDLGCILKVELGAEIEIGKN